MFLLLLQIPEFIIHKSCAVVSVSLTLTMSPLFILRLAAATILVVFGQTSSAQRVGCDPAGCRSDLFNLTETLHMLAGRDHSSFNLETGEVARAFIVPHIDPEPVPEPVAPEPVDPLNPESPNVVAVNSNHPIDPATWATKASTVPGEPSATSLASLAASDALQLTQALGLLSTTTEPSGPLFTSATTAATSTYALASSSTTTPRYITYTGVANPVFLQTRAAFAALAGLAAYLL